MRFRFDLNASATSAPTLDEGELTTVLGANSVRFLGAGTFGESWAFERAGATMVAKVLLDPHTTSNEVMREVKPLTRVSSPHVVRLQEVLALTLPAGQRLALVFEYIGGGDILSLVQGGAWPSTHEVRAFLEGALRGLVALHEQEIVHRDIKPQNIAPREGDWGKPVLLDLGLGRLLDESTKTLYPQAVGTAPFMAPEVVEGRPARKGSDLWSLGVVTHLLMTHEHPFFPDPAEVLDEDEAYQRLIAGPPGLPASTPEPLSVVVPRLLSVLSFERGSAARALREIQR